MIYADLDCLLEKMHSCQNNLGKSYTEKKLSIHLLAIHCLKIVHLIQQKISLIVTKGTDCMETFCKELKEHTIRIVNYEKKEMMPVTDEENRSDKKKFATYVKKNLILMKMIKMNLNYTKKSEIIVISTTKFRGALIVFAI